MTPEQEKLVAIWEAHMKDAFVDKSVDAMMASMCEGSVVNHVPTMTGGHGVDAIRAFRAKYFIHTNPPDTETHLVSRTVGDTQLVDEFIFRFTHTQEVPWILPRVPPTGKRVEVPLVAIIAFKDGKVFSEQIYWDQASVLVQVGLLDPTGLPVVGKAQADKVLDPSLPSNELIEG